MLKQRRIFSGVWNVRDHYNGASRLGCLLAALRRALGRWTLGGGGLGFGEDGGGVGGRGRAGELVAVFQAGQRAGTVSLGFRCRWP